jgi:muramoyltetrapeptide carboxypeptidase
MDNPIFAPKLQNDDLIRMIAPSHSYAIDSESQRQLAAKRFTDDLGLRISFGKHVEERDEFDSSSIRSRLSDLHEAFADPEIRAVICIEGGFNSNQLLPYIDWELIKDNPKVFIGYSDITALCNAIYAKTDLVTYHGPMFSTFGMKLHFEYTLEYFKKCVMQSDPYEVVTSPTWSDDFWEADQDNRELMDNPGPLVIHPGKVQGTLVGGNLSTLNLLQGTEFMPKFDNSILFIEDDYEWKSFHFDRAFTSLTQQPGFEKVKAVLIGKFQKESEVTTEILFKMIDSKEILKTVPVVANIDFGHTNPKITLPVGGAAEVTAKDNSAKIKIVSH